MWPHCGNKRAAMKCLIIIAAQICIFISISYLGIKCSSEKAIFVVFQQIKDRKDNCIVCVFITNIIRSPAFSTSHEAFCLLLQNLTEAMNNSKGVLKYNVTWRLKAGIVEPERTSIAEQYFCKHDLEVTQSTAEPPLLSSRMLRFVAKDKTNNNRMSELFELVIYILCAWKLVQSRRFHSREIRKTFFREIRQTDVVEKEFSVWAVIIDCNCKEVPINQIIRSRIHYY
jgi:hypothetical protein